MLKIPKIIYDKMLEHCKSELPNEACGILGGRDNVVTEIYCMENIEKSPESFLMNPKEQLDVWKDLRKKDIQMLAIFHSHPSSPARPSKKDIDMAFYEDISYIIVSLQEENPKIRAFNIKEEKAEEVPIEVLLLF